MARDPRHYSRQTNRAKHAAVDDPTEQAYFKACAHRHTRAIVWHRAKLAEPCRGLGAAWLSLLLAHVASLARVLPHFRL